MKKILFLLTGMSMLFACQKEIVSDLDTALEVVAENDTLITSGETSTPINITLSDYYAGVKLNIDVTNGKIDNQTSLTNIDPLGENYSKTFHPTPGFSGKAYVKVTIVGSSVSKTIELTLLNAEIDDVLDLSLVDTSAVLANNLDAFKLNVQVNELTAQNVILTCSKGKFALSNSQQMTLPLSNNQGEAVVICSQELGLHQITCSIPNTSFSKSVYVTPNIAYPETIQLIPVSWTIPASATSAANGVSLTAMVQRAVGQTTVDRPISIRAYQLVNSVQVNVGSFTNLPLKTNAAETATCVYYNTPNVDPNLILYIEVQTTGTSGVISHTIQLDVL